VRETLRFLKMGRGIEIHHDGDLPGRSGTGSSSAFTVGLLHALHALQGRAVGKKQLANESIHLEQDVLKETVGSQDQVAVAFGGLNRIEFGGQKDFFVSPVTIGEQRIKYLRDHMMLFFTGFSRTAHEIAGEQIKKTPMIHDELCEMKSLVDKAVAILNDPKKDITEFGRLLNKGWEIKRGLTGIISNNEIDNIYKTALKAGAIGGKLLGAGGGGFMLLFAEPEAQPKIKKALEKLLYVPFEFEDLGSQVILYSTQDFY